MSPRCRRSCEPIFKYDKVPVTMQYISSLQDSRTQIQKHIQLFEAKIFFHFTLFEGHSWIRIWIQNFETDLHCHWPKWIWIITLGQTHLKRGRLWFVYNYWFPHDENYENKIYVSVLVFLSEWLLYCMYEEAPFRVIYGLAGGQTWHWSTKTNCSFFVLPLGKKSVQILKLKGSVRAAWNRIGPAKSRSWVRSYVT